MGFVPTGKFGGINNPARTDSTVPRSVTKWGLERPRQVEALDWSSEPTIVKSDHQLSTRKRKSEARFIEY
jgi:hypothetical protein